MSGGGAQGGGGARIKQSFSTQEVRGCSSGGLAVPPPSLRKVLYRVGVGGRIGVRAHGEKSGSTWRSHPSTSIGRIRGCGFLTIRCQLQLWRE